MRVWKPRFINKKKKKTSLIAPEVEASDDPRTAGRNSGGSKTVVSVVGLNNSNSCEIDNSKQSKVADNFNTERGGEADSKYKFDGGYERFKFSFDGIDTIGQTTISGSRSRGWENETGESYSTNWTASTSSSSAASSGLEFCVDLLSSSTNPASYGNNKLCGMCISEQDYYEIDTTPLFEAIKRRWWLNIKVAFSSGWQLFPFVSYSSSSSERLPLEEQVCTWATCRDKRTGNLIWQQLPIHAALGVKAPLYIIQQLVESYPPGLSCPDEGGNLPLHVAFQYNAPDEIIFFLLSGLPQAINATNSHGLTPVEIFCKTELDDDSEARLRLFRYFAKHGNNISQENNIYSNQRSTTTTTTSTSTTKLAHQYTTTTNETKKTYYEDNDRRRRSKKATAEQKLENLINELDELEMSVTVSRSNSKPTSSSHV